MNWLEYARNEICKITKQRTANTAEGSPTAAMAVRPCIVCSEQEQSIGSNGSRPTLQLLKSIASGDDLEERAAIMEFDGGLSRAQSEKLALANQDADCGY